MATISKLKLPIKFVHPNLKNVEIIDNIDYLKYQTMLGVKEKSFLNCYLISGDDYYKIIDILDKGIKGPWWKFEFFNPMINIELILSLVEEEDVLNKLKSLNN